MNQYTVSFPHRLPNTANTSYSAVGNGVIIMPGISGYPKWMPHPDDPAGKIIISQLLLSILEHNHLELQVAGIEGNAVLFYKYGAPPAAAAILKQYKYMLEGFREKLAQLGNQFAQPLALSLKLVAHYGQIAEHKRGEFKKLSGEAIIEAHCLLKNAINSSSYALLTDELLKATPTHQEKKRPLGLNGNKLCEVYGELRSICFTYFDCEYSTPQELIA